MSSSKGRRRRNIDGIPHHMAGRMDTSRRAKSQGCQGGGTLRRTASRGWRSDEWTAALEGKEDCWIADVSTTWVNGGGGVAGVLLAVPFLTRSDLKGFGDEGTEEARWCWL
jgi:hypothetical protein